MKNFLFLILSVLFFVSCSDEIPEEKPALKSGRTILAYLISNNKSGSLDSNLKQNLVDMYTGLTQTTDSCTLIVYYRPYNNDVDGLEGPSLLQYNSDGKGNINNKKCLENQDLTAANVIKAASISVYPDESHNAVDKKTMSRILEQMVKLCPSTNYGLIFGSHGTSWMPGNEVVGRSFGDDGGYNINIPEMSDVLEEVFSGKQLDFILFDACMMATAEVCYEFKDVTDYLIGAVVETHVYGHPYDIIMPKLFTKDIPYDEICKNYIDYSRQLGLWGTCAAIDCRKMDDLANWVADKLDEYSDSLVDLDIDEIQQYGVGQFKYFSFDLVDCFRVLNDENTIESLENSMNQIVVSKDALYGSQYPTVGNPSYTIEEDHFCGIGMYVPYKVTKTSWNTYYETLSWYKAVGWERFKTLLTNNQ